MIPEIWAGGSLAYALIAFFTMRSAYKAWRPYKVPLNCRDPEDDAHAHYWRCYRQDDGMDSEHEARWAALFMGLFWPIVAAVMLVMGSAELLFASRELPAEKSWREAQDRKVAALKTRALEEANEELRRAQEG